LQRTWIFFLKSFYYQWVLRIEKPCIARWSHARAKKHSPRQKRRWFLFSKCGLRRFSPVIPLPPRLFAETRNGEFRSFSQPFLASAPAFFPGQQRNGPKRPTKLEMIQKEIFFALAFTSCASCFRPPWGCALATYGFFRASTPGRAFPSRSSRKAPPAVEM